MVPRGACKIVPTCEKWHFCAGARLNNPILSEFLEPFYSKMPLNTSVDLVEIYIKIKEYAIFISEILGVIWLGNLISGTRY